MEKILSISLKLNLTPNTLGSYGLRKYRVPVLLRSHHSAYALRDTKQPYGKIIRRKLHGGLGLCALIGQFVSFRCAVNHPQSAPILSDKNILVMYVL